MKWNISSCINTRKNNFYVKYLASVRGVLYNFTQVNWTIVKAILLSYVSVQRKVDEMAVNTDDTLYNMLRITKFSLQLDESTLPVNEPLLLAYVHFVEDENLVQEQDN